MDILTTDFQFETLDQAASPWEVQSHGQARITSVREGDSVRLDISGHTGVGWHAEFRYRSLPIQKGTKYTLHFSARAEVLTKISVWVGQTDSPWANCGLSEMFELPTHFQPFTFHFCGSRDENRARINFPVGLTTNRIWIKGLELSQVLPKG